MMHLYLTRNGNVEGPYPAEQVKKMIQQGELAHTDLAATPGDQDWKPLSHWIAVIDDGGTPPPMPSPQSAPAWDAPFLIDGKSPSGTAGKTVRQVCEEVANGGRFIIYPYVFSIIILSFRRSSPIQYVPPGRSGAGKAIQWSLISMLFGWWGIPWGIFFTIGALWRNAAGGIDVTEPIIASLAGPERTRTLLSQRPKPPVGGLWLLRGMIATPLILLALMIFGIVSGASSYEAEQAKIPGYPEYQAANTSITRTSTTTGKGNTESSSRAAQTAASIMHDWFKQATNVDPDAPRKGIAVWCEAQSDRAIFLVKIPELRSFNKDAKGEICHAAWIAAQIAARELGLEPGAELAVAVRGSALYDRMLVGQVLTELPDDDSETEKAFLDAIARTDRGLQDGEKFAAYFAPPES